MNLENADVSLKKLVVDKWIRKQLLLNESRKHVDHSVEIEKRVEAYREALQIQMQKERILRQQLDTVVGRDELQMEYDSIEASFTLEHKLLKCQLFLIPSDFESIKDAKSSFQAKKWEDWNKIIENQPTFTVLDSFNYTDWFKIRQYLSKDVLKESSVEAEKVYTGMMHDKHFFLKVYRVVEKGEKPPLEFLKEKIRKTILHNRKNVFLEEYERKLYEKAMQRNEIEIY